MIIGTIKNPFEGQQSLISSVLSGDGTNKGFRDIDYQEGFSLRPIGLPVVDYDGRGLRRRSTLRPCSGGITALRFGGGAKH